MMFFKLILSFSLFLWKYLLSLFSELEVLVSPGNLGSNFGGGASLMADTLMVDLFSSHDFLSLADSTESCFKVVRSFLLSLEELRRNDGNLK